MMTIVDSGKMISLMMEKADAYTTFDCLEKYVEEGKDLSVIPIQPLFMILRSRPYEEVASYLPHCSLDQRKIFLDLDLWKRDDLDIESFSFWLRAYSLCPDEKIRLEFSQSSEFSLYLKARFNIWTFDVEEPQYPDHDNFFLTDDNLLLFEFDESFDDIGEVKRLILDLYSAEGVEKAYCALFKTVSDSFLSMQEIEFQSKKERLRDIGFVDYYEALELESPFPNKNMLNNFIRKKVTVTGEIDEFGKNQILPKSSLIAFRDKIGPLEDELNKVTEEKRSSFLQFNFLRLVNGTMELDDSLKQGSMALTRTGNRTKSIMMLGLDYLKVFIKEESLSWAEGVNLFDIFEFIDIYRIGNSLIKWNQKKIKKALRETPFDNGNESFLGRFLAENLNFSFDMPLKFWELKRGVTKTTEVNNWEKFQEWNDIVYLICSLIPFISKFFKVYEKLKKSGTINSGYYLNYTVEDITFESILLSAYANYRLGFFENVQENKMGVTIDEYKSFVRDILDENLKLKETRDFENSLHGFLKSFGLNQIINFKDYFTFILAEEMEGTDISSIKDIEFRHLGGPIVLNSLEPI